MPQMKMTPGGLSGLHGHHRNPLNDNPIVVDLCDSASPLGGRALLGVKVDGIIMLVQTKQPLPSGLQLLFRSLWLHIYLTTTRRCFEIFSPCTHSLSLDLSLQAVSCMEVPSFTKSHQRMIYCSKLGKSNNSWSGVLFLPTVLCPFSTADYLYIPTTLPSSHPSLVLAATSDLNLAVTSRGSSHMWEDADSKYFCPFFVLICAGSRILRCISGLCT